MSKKYLKTNMDETKIEADKTDEVRLSPEELRKEARFLDAEYEDAEPLEENIEKPEDTVLFGWFFWRMLIVAIPVLGLIYAIIDTKLTRNISKKRFLHAGIVWNTILSCLAAFIVLEACNFIKDQTGIFKSYLGDYGSTTEFASDLINEDWESVVRKIDFEKLIDTTGFTFKNDMPSNFPYEKILALLDFDTVLNRTDFETIDWSGLSDNQLQNLYDSLPKQRINTR